MYTREERPKAIPPGRKPGESRAPRRRERKASRQGQRQESQHEHADQQDHPEEPLSNLLAIKTIAFAKNKQILAQYYTYFFSMSRDSS
jgi:hypothetical protein